MRTSAVRFDFVSNTEASRSLFSGGVTTVARAGDRLRAKVSTSNASDRATSAERAILKALYGRLRGQANRLWLIDPSYRQRGSFPSQELLTNNTFANGTTGWAASTGWASLSVSDRVMRSTMLRNVSSSSNLLNASSATAVTQYKPVVGRMFLNRSNYTGSAGLRWFNGAGVSIEGETVSTSAGLLTSKITPFESSIYIVYTDQSSGTDSNAGHFVDFHWTSLSQCALIDNSPNLLTYSDQFDNAAWVSLALASTAANATVSPDGTTTADSIVENSSAGNHGKYQAVTVSSAAADYCVSVCAKAGARTYVQLRMDELTGSSQTTCIFNLTTGVAGSTVAGTNWSNARAFSVSLGNGWYRLFLVARKTNAATQVQPVLLMSSDGSSISYTGDGTSNIYLWRGALAQSSVPFIPAQTTSSASSGTSQSGSSLNIKGLPASTSGLLLQGDLVQIGTDLNMVVASLDSDAAGCGVLQLYRPLRTAPADNDPVIINSPMGRFVATSNETGWDESPGGFANFEREFEEALDQ